MITFLIAFLAAFSAADAIVRLLLFLRAPRVPRVTRGKHDRPLIIIPARGEGAGVAATLASTQGAPVLLLLDGADAEAEAVGHAHGAQVVVKEPAGPTKAAALAWLARTHRSLIESAGTVLLLDVGSTLAPSFFEHFVWPEGADAVQTQLEGSAGAAADSERFAQEFEDRGREALGWNVRLRGTGTAFRAAVFLDLAPRLATRVEDFEASLLLHRAVIRMAPPEAIVIDEKPESVRSTALQRARWLVGRYELLIRRAPALMTLIARRPAEGLAWLVEVFGRPLSLTVPLRIVAGALLIWKRQPVAGVAIAATTLVDAALFVGRTSPKSVLRLAASWMLAAAMTPRALVRWTRVERR